MKSYTRVYATVDLDAVAHNMEAMKKNLAPGTGIIGVVKTDGYGHGAVPIAEAIDEFVCGYAVATIEEGIQLRRHGMVKPVLVLGVTHESRYEALIAHDIRATVFRPEQAQKLSETAVSMGKTAKVHLALDTGMSRIGMTATPESADMVETMSRLSGIDMEGLFTHFSRADEADKTTAFHQLEQYLNFVKLLEERNIKIPVKHCSNSAGILELKEAHLDVVRAGISIYGLYPSDEVGKTAVPLEPVMELKSFITYIKTIPAHTSVSYGGKFVSEKEMAIATIPIGYGDGYPRNQSNRGSVLIHGKRAPILGRVCMDQMMVDVTEIPEAKEEDPVTLIGRDGTERISVEEIARIGGGFHYEILCDIGKRVPRVYVKGGKVTGTKDYFDDVYQGFGYL